MILWFQKQRDHWQGRGGLFFNYQRVSEGSIGLEEGWGGVGAYIPTKPLRRQKYI